MEWYRDDLEEVFKKDLFPNFEMIYQKQVFLKKKSCK